MNPLNIFRISAQKADPDAIPKAVPRFAKIKLTDYPDILVKCDICHASEIDDMIRRGPKAGFRPMYEDTVAWLTICQVCLDVGKAGTA